MSTADNFYKQIGPRLGPTKCWGWSGSQLFDTLMVFLKDFLKKKVEFEDKKNMQNYPGGKESQVNI